MADEQGCSNQSCLQAVGGTLGFSRRRNFQFPHCEIRLGCSHPPSQGYKPPVTGQSLQVRRCHNHDVKSGIPSSCLRCCTRRLPPDEPPRLSLQLFPCVSIYCGQNLSFNTGMISTERGDLVRRKTFLILAAAVILVLGLRFFANEKLTSENSQLEIQLTEYNTANQFSASGSPLAELQNSVDKLSRAALEGQWRAHRWPKQN